VPSASWCGFNFIDPRLQSSLMLKVRKRRPGHEVSDMKSACQVWFAACGISSDADAIRSLTLAATWKSEVQRGLDPPGTVFAPTPRPPCRLHRQAKSVSGVVRQMRLDYGDELASVARRGRHSCADRSSCIHSALLRDAIAMVILRTKDRMHGAQQGCHFWVGQTINDGSRFAASQDQLPLTQVGQLLGQGRLPNACRRFQATDGGFALR